MPLTPKKQNEKAEDLLRLEYLEKMLKHNTSQLATSFKNVLNWKTTKPEDVTLSAQNIYTRMEGFRSYFKEYSQLKKKKYV